MSAHAFLAGVVVSFTGVRVRFLVRCAPECAAARCRASHVDACVHRVPRRSCCKHSLPTMEARCCPNVLDTQPILCMARHKTKPRYCTVPLPSLYLSSRRLPRCTQFKFAQPLMTSMLATGEAWSDARLSLDNGMWVVSLKWLTTSLRSHRREPEMPYIVTKRVQVEAGHGGAETDIEHAGIMASQAVVPSQRSLGSGSAVSTTNGSLIQKGEQRLLAQSAQPAPIQLSPVPEVSAAQSKAAVGCCNLCVGRCAVVRRCSWLLACA